MTTPDEMLRYAMGSLTQPSIKLTDHMLRYAMGAMGIGSPKEAAKFRLFWNFAIEAMDHIDPDKERQAEAIAKANGITAAPVVRGNLAWSLDECDRVMRTLHYLIGIAERGEGRTMRDDETAEAFVLAYVQKLEAVAAAAPAAPVAQPVSDADILNAIAANYHAAPAAPVARHVGDTRFEGWLSCHEPDRSQNRTLRYSKQDMRDAYWAGYSEASAATAAPVAHDIRRALELARDAMALQLNPAGAWPANVRAAQVAALKAIDAALSAPAAPVAPAPQGIGQGGAA